MREKRKAVQEGRVRDQRKNEREEQCRELIRQKYKKLCHLLEHKGKASNESYLIIEMHLIISRMHFMNIYLTKPLR